MKHITMYYALFIRARFRPEIMERILRVVRHRGFELCSLNMFTCNKLDNKEIRLFLIVSSKRAIHLLFSQLNKLIDVDYVEIR